MSALTFWERLEKTELLKPAAVRSLRAQFLALEDNDSKTISPAVWLERSGVLTEFQSKLLRGGLDRSIHFGEYTITQRRPAVLGWPTLAGRHRPTGHEVQLCFFRGVDARDVARWTASLERLAVARTLSHPSWLRVFDFVELQNYRFFVIEAAPGMSLEQRLGARGRLPWNQACGIVHALATAVGQWHPEGLAHGNINGREVFLESGGFPRLSPALAAARVNYEGSPGELADEINLPRHYVDPSRVPHAVGPLDDRYALAVLLYRLIRGETPGAWMEVTREGPRDLSAAIRKLSKYDIPPALESLLSIALQTESPSPPAPLDEFLQGLDNIPGWKPLAQTASARTKSDEAYQDWLERWRPPVPQSPPVEVARPVLATPFETPVIVDTNREGSASRQTGNGLKKRKSIVPAIVWGGCAAALFFSMVLVYQFRRAPKPDQTIPVGSSAVTPPVSTLPPAPVENSPESIVANNWIQKVVEDDGQTLWESPTNGSAVNFQFLAPNPLVVVVARPQALLALGENAQITRSLGTEFASRLQSLRSELSVPLESIEQLVIAGYPGEGGGYEWLYRVRLADPMPADALRAQWSSQGFVVDPAEPMLAVLGARAVGICESTPKVPQSESSEPTTLQVEQFVSGPRNLVAVARLSTASAIAGPMIDLAERADVDRHLTILGTTAGLFSERGLSNIPQPFRALAKKIAAILPQQVRAIGLSVHHDQGVYAEVYFDRSADIRADALSSTIDSRWKSAREELIAHLEKMPVDDYWDKVRRRFDDMLGDVSRRMRIGVEYDQVLINAWLPPMAAHNVLAASELALAAGGESSPPAATSPAIPRTVGDVLQTRRTLKNDNPPDLNVLLDSLQSEVREDLPTLPFPFEIRISNADLAEAGITRNQRLSALDLVDQPLEQILTRICFLANPDKNASGPEDPRCALIWVIMHDPESSQEIILITTRAAAAKNGWSLPSPFTAGS